MRTLKITLGLTSAVLLAASTYQAQATVASGSAKVGATAQSMTPIKPAACRGSGAHCPPGYIWNGNRCVLC